MRDLDIERRRGGLGDRHEFKRKRCSSFFFSIIITVRRAKRKRKDLHYFNNQEISICSDTLYSYLYLVIRPHRYRQTIQSSYYFRVQCSCASVFPSLYFCCNIIYHHHHHYKDSYQAHNEDVI